LLRKIFGPKRDEVTGDRRNEELNDLYSSPNMIRVIKSRRMRWPWHVARMRERRGFWWGNMRERDHLGDPDVLVRIILRWIYRKWDVGTWIGSSWLVIRIGGGLL
jgi:hypothetical protein